MTVASRGTFEERLDIHKLSPSFSKGLSRTVIKKTVHEKRQPRGNPGSNTGRRKQGNVSFPNSGGRGVSAATGANYMAGLATMSGAFRQTDSEMGMLGFYFVCKIKFSSPVTSMRNIGKRCTAGPRNSLPSFAYNEP